MTVVVAQAQAVALVLLFICVMILLIALGLGFQVLLERRGARGREAEEEAHRALVSVFTALREQRREDALTARRALIRAAHAAMSDHESRLRQQDEEQEDWRGGKR